MAVVATVEAVDMAALLVPMMVTLHENDQLHLKST